MKIEIKKSSIIVLVIILLVVMLARCSGSKVDLPKAKGFEKQLNKVIQEVLDTDEVEVTEYEQEGNMITCKIAGVVYTGVIRNGKVISVFAFLDYKLMTSVSEDGRLLLTTLLGIPAAVFDDKYTTQQSLAALIRLVESNRVEDDDNSVHCEYTEGDIEYSYTATTYEFLTGYMFQARYIG